MSTAAHDPTSAECCGPRSRGAPSSAGEAPDSVVYGVIPPLFGSPPLRATTAALPDLADLGVDVLWLSPIFETPPRDYGYAVVDYLRIRTDYGDRSDVAALVRAAHDKGIRVIFDLPANHTSDRHRYFVDAAAKGRASHYWSFYLRDTEGKPTHYFDWTNLPNLDYDNPEVDRWMLEIGRRWLEDTGADGYRIDAAWAVAERDPKFWDAFRDEIRRTDPRAWLLAEASARDPYWSARGFEAYDWTDAPGQWSWKDVFDAPSAIPDRLDAAVRTGGPRPLRFLENNDTGARFVTRHGPEMTRVAAVALFTLPGIPSLFMGQDRGAEYDPYRTSTPLPTRDPHGLRGWYRMLVALRHSLADLRSAPYARLPVHDASVLAYRRGDVVVALRFGSHGGRVAVDDLTGSHRDALSGETVRGTFELGPWGARVLVPTR